MHKHFSIDAMYHIWQEQGASRIGCQCNKTGFRNKSKKKKFRKLTLKHTNQIEKWTTCLVKRQRHSAVIGFLNTSIHSGIVWAISHDNGNETKNNRVLQ